MNRGGLSEKQLAGGRAGQHIHTYTTHTGSQPSLHQLPNFYSNTSRDSLRSATDDDLVGWWLSISGARQESVSLDENWGTIKRKLWEHSTDIKHCLCQRGLFRTPSETWDTNGELENIKSYVKIFKVSDIELHTDLLLQILVQISLLIERISWPSLQTHLPSCQNLLVLTLITPGFVSLLSLVTTIIA